MKRRRAVALPPPGDGMIHLRLDEVYGGMVRERAAQQDASLLALAASIARHGLLSPILVRRNAQAGRYAVICGARRVLACRMLGLGEIDAIVLPVDEAEAAACFLEEHATRRDVPFLDEAELIARVGERRLAESTAGDARALARRTAMLALDARVRERIRQGNLRLEQAEPLLGITDVQRQIEAAEIIGARTLTPEQARRLVYGPWRRGEGETGGRRRLLRAAAEAAEHTARLLERRGLASRVSVQAQEHGVCIRILIRNAQNGAPRQENG